MKQPNIKVKMIAAVAYDSKIIGVDGKMPWHIPKELKHFKKTTENSAMIMGRKTYESLPQQVIDSLAETGRSIVVLTRDLTKRTVDYPPYVSVAHDRLNALDLAKRLTNSDSIYICGGTEVFVIFMAYTESYILSVISIDIPYNKDSQYALFPMHLLPSFTHLKDSVEHPGKIPFTVYTFKKHSKVP